MSVPQLGQAGRVCGACRYFDAKGGLCRFTSPTPTGWPKAREIDWCGEWTPARTATQAGEDEIPNIPTLAARDDVSHRIGARR